MALATALIFLNFLAALVNADLTEDLNITRVKTAQYDELYTDATYAYNLKNYCTSMKKFELALADYKHDNKVKTHCREKCYKKFQDSLGQRHIQFLLEDIELEYFRLTVYSRRCTQKCFQKFLGQRSHVSQRIKDEFESKRLYQFLHFAYYKVNIILTIILPLFFMILATSYRGRVDRKSHLAFALSQTNLNNIVCKNVILIPQNCHMLK